MFNHTSSISPRPAVLAALLAVALLAGCTANAASGSPAGSVPLPPTNSAWSVGTDVAPVTVPTAAGTTASVPVPAGSSAETSAPTTDLTSELNTATSTATSPPPVVLPGAGVTASPALGSTGLSPTGPITVTVTHGTLKKVTLTNQEGIQVQGSLSADRTTWTLGEALGYGKTYTVTGKATGEDGASVPINGTWTTLTPDAEITTSISPGDGALVGVAAPVIVHFGFRPDDPDLILKQMKITTVPKTEGAWAWIQHDGDDYPSLDWRPRKYWKAGTKVHVESAIYGVKFTDGYYGGDDATSDFTIGRNQVVIADAASHQIVVQREGITVATYPASFGMGDDPDSQYGLKSQFVTRSGIHVVTSMDETTTMQLPGYYAPVEEHWAVRISDNGEFIHENPNTVDAQGNRNVSHGCINLSPESAEAYFGSAMFGDPVEVSGTSVDLSAADGDVYDWAIPWKTWLSMSDASYAS